MRSCRSRPPDRSVSQCPPQTQSHLRSPAARGRRLGNRREKGEKNQKTDSNKDKSATVCLYETTSKNSSKHKHTNQINPQNTLLASLSLSFSLYLPPPLLFLFLSDYLYISICHSESTVTMCTHTRTCCQRDKKSRQMAIGLYVCEANVRAMSQELPWHLETAQPEGPAKMKRPWQAVAPNRSKQQQESVSYL